jgi:hypothetical protein
MQTEIDEVKIKIKERILIMVLQNRMKKKDSNLGISLSPRAGKRSVTLDKPRLDSPNKSSPIKLMK